MLNSSTEWLESILALPTISGASGKEIWKKRADRLVTVMVIDSRGNFLKYLKFSRGTMIEKQSSLCGIPITLIEIPTLGDHVLLLSNFTEDQDFYIASLT